MREREHEVFPPREENLGKNCRFWNPENGCRFPKTEMGGRKSCEGIVDDVCLYFKDRKPPKSLTTEELLELKFRGPGMSPLDIPQGGIEV